MPQRAWMPSEGYFPSDSGPFTWEECELELSGREQFSMSEFIFSSSSPDRGFGSLRLLGVTHIILAGLMLQSACQCRS